MITHEKSLLEIRAVRRILKISADLVVAVMALVIAIFLRYEGSVPAALSAALLWLIPFTAATKLTTVFFAGDYLRLWRYTSLREAFVLSVAIAGSTAVFVIGRLSGLVPLPLTVIAIDGAFTLLGMAAVRGLRRVLDPVLRGKIVVHLGHNGSEKESEISGENQPKRTLVLGAGSTANSLLGDLQRHVLPQWKIVGLLDDDASKQGEKLRGYSVLGTTAQLESVIRRLGVEHVMIAIPTLQKMVVRGLISRAQSCGASVQSVPTLEGLWQTSRRAPGSPVTLNDLMDSAEVKRSLLPNIRRDRVGQTVLVTGGGGYIGVHLVRKLLDRGMRVRVLDNFVYGEEGLRPLMGHPELEVVRGDISNLRDIVSSVKDVDAVVALAAIVGDPACSLNAEETLTLNYEATKILVEACNFYGVERLLFASSCSVYGASQDELLTETSPLNPVSLYARTRILSEEVLRDRCGDVQTTILRLATVFGLSPRMRFDLVVNTLSVRAVVDRKIQIFGGDQWRPFVHCDDVADAFSTILTAPKNAVADQTFNVGSSLMNYTLATVGDLVASRVGPDVTVEHGDFLEDRRNYRVSFDKIATLVGWKPRHSLESGVDELIDAIRKDACLRDYQQPRFSNLKHLKGHFEASGLLDIDMPNAPNARPVRLT